MKKVFLFLCVFCSIKSICIGQAASRKNIDTYNSSGYLYVVYLPNGNIIQTENLILSAESSVLVSMISRVETIKRYGVITKVGAVILKAKPQIQFIVLNQILSLFNIHKDDINLPVYIDDKYVCHPENILAEKNEITAATIITDPLNRQKRVIDIITKGYNTSKLINSKKTTPYSEYYLQDNEVTAVDSFLNISLTKRVR